MNSLSNNLRFLESISSNDKLGLYDLYPSCNYVNDVYNNFEYWNKNNYNMNMLFLFYIILSIVLIIIIKTIFYINYEDNTVYDYDRETEISREIELERY